MRLKLIFLSEVFLTILFSIITSHFHDYFIAESFMVEIRKSIIGNDFLIWSKLNRKYLKRKII